MSKTIMAVGAHTGDAQLTCGMLLAKHAMQGDKIIIVDLTAGEKGTPKGMTPEEFRPQNIAAAAEFAKGLGGKSIVLDTLDGNLQYTQDAAIQLAEIMREHQVNSVLYHWRQSIHRDHLAAHKITEDAIFYASLPTYPVKGTPAPIRNFMCAENWEDAEGFNPYFYFDVSDAFPLWKENIKKLWLAENSTSFKYLRYYEALSIANGALIGKNHATRYCQSPQCPAARVLMETL